MYSFSNKVVMVTGAAGNVGRAVAVAFQAAGAKLALVDLGEERLQQTFPEFISSPDHFLGNCADLTDADAVEAVVSNTIERFARIDVLVNTVGGFRAGTALHETPVETWDFLLNLNARSVYMASRSVIPHMLKHRWGKIISLAARPGLAGHANMAAYSVSKSAVIRMTESMAAELRDFGINVNCILPGTIDTPQNREATPDADHGRWVKPEALADVILFLASDAAHEVHGAALPVYGRS